MYCGTKQGRIDSMRLFVRTVSHHLEPLIRRWNQQGIGVRLDDVLCNILGLADDIILFASSVEMLVDMIKDISGILESIGLRVNIDKCSFMAVSCYAPDSIQVKGQSIKRVRSLKILGCYLSCDASIDDDIDYKIDKAWRVFYKHKRILYSQTLDNRQKLLLLNKVINPVFAYGCQLYTSQTCQTNRFDVTFVDMVCKICKIGMHRHERYDDFLQRKRSQLKSLCRDLCVTPCYVLARRYWTYFGHVQRSPRLAAFCNYRDSIFGPTRSQGRV